MIPPNDTFHVAVRWTGPVPHSIGTAIASDDFEAGEGDSTNRASVFFPGTYGIVDPSCTPPADGWFNMCDLLGINPDFLIEIDRCKELFQYYEDDVIPPPDTLEAEPPSKVPSCFTPYVPDADDPIKTVCLNFHVWQRSDGTGNYQNTADHIAQFEETVVWLNHHYRAGGQPHVDDECPFATYDQIDTRIRFKLNNVFFYQDDNLINQIYFGPLHTAAFAAHPDARNQLNIYWSQGTYSTAAAWARTPSFQNLTYDQGIVFFHTYHEGAADEGVIYWPIVITFAHEIGHILDLLHTYYSPKSPGSSETCDANSCFYMNDLFCPPTNVYDPPCWHQAGWSCNYDKPGNKCTNNLMGGTRDSRHATPLQMGKMHRALEISSARRYLIPICSPPPRDIVMWLTLDDPTGPTAKNAPGDYHGTYVNSPDVVPGKVDKGLLFNGVNSYVEVPSYWAINFGADDFSIEAWVRRLPGDDYVRVIVDKRKDDGTGTCGYELYLHYGQIGFQLADEGYTNYPSGAVVPDDGWHHVAVTVDRSATDGIKFYLDGQLLPQTGNPVAHQGTVSTTKPLRVGSLSDQVGSVFHGYIDEVSLYRRELTGSEISEIYGAGNGGKCKQYCRVPQEWPFPLWDQSVTVTARLYNSTTEDQFMHAGFQQLLAGSPTWCGSIDGPANKQFSPSTTAYTVFAGECCDFNLVIGRPAGLVGMGQIGCYEMFGSGPITYETYSSRGSVKGFGFKILNPNGSDILIPDGPVPLDAITVINTQDETATFNYRFEATLADGSPDTLTVSLDGGLPGTPVLDSVTVDSGDSVNINLTVEFVEPDTVSAYLLTMQAEMEDKWVTLASMTLSSSNQGCCELRGDLDHNGAVDIADILYYVEFSFGSPPGPAPVCNDGTAQEPYYSEADLDGSMTVDIADILYFVEYSFGSPPGPAPVPCP